MSFSKVNFKLLDQIHIDADTFEASSIHYENIAHKIFYVYRSTADGRFLERKQKFG